MAAFSENLVHHANERDLLVGEPQTKMRKTQVSNLVFDDSTGSAT
jgi:hypothetical protein